MIDHNPTERIKTRKRKNKNKTPVNAPLRSFTLYNIPRRLSKRLVRPRCSAVKTQNTQHTHTHRERDTHTHMLASPTPRRTRLRGYSHAYRAPASTRTAPSTSQTSETTKYGLRARRPPQGIRQYTVRCYQHGSAALSSKKKKRSNKINEGDSDSNRTRYHSSTHTHNK